MNLMLATLSLLVLGCHVRVQCQDAEIRALLMANYGHMQGSRGPATLQYTVARQAQSSSRDCDLISISSMRRCLRSNTQP